MRNNARPADRVCIDSSSYRGTKLSKEVLTLIVAKELTKQYGDKLALDHASFVIEEGQVVGLLGLNGAGKSTTMNILTGCISATGGNAIIGGYDIAKNPRQAKALIGYLPEQPAFYPEMKVREHLDFICGLKGVGDNRARHIGELCEMVGLSGMQGRMIRNLSKGYRQRLGFAQALAGHPKVIILDEPTVGLDPSQIIEIRQLIKDAGRRSTVIVSSHILTEIQAVCNRIIMLKKGRVIADCPMEEMIGRLASGNRVRVRIQGSVEEIAPILGRISQIGRVDVLGQQEPGAWDYVLESTSGEDIRVPVFRALAAVSLPLLSMQGSDVSLEEAFLSLEVDNPQKEGTL